MNNFSGLRGGFCQVSRLLSRPGATLLLIVLLVNGLVLSLRHWGALQFLELLIYDALTRQQPDRGIDSRLLIVEITETDIRALRRWPAADETYAMVLANLQRHNPVAIGLDVIRDFPNEPGYGALVNEFQKPNVIAAISPGNSPEEKIAAPPSVPEDRLGSVDLAVDPDGVLRQHMLFKNHQGKIYTSFGLQLALLYFDSRGVPISLTSRQEYQIGETVLPKLPPNAGGYSQLGSGYSILLTYRSAHALAPRITLTQVLTQSFEPNLVKGRIVLIGATAPSLRDFFNTPYSRQLSGQRQMPGVVIHAQAVSQLLSIVLDGQPLFRFWPDQAEILWTIFWSLSGVVLVLALRNPGLVVVGQLLLALSLYGVTALLFSQSVWIPLAAPMASLVCTVVALTLYRLQVSWQQQQMVMRLLGQQTSPEIAVALWRSRSQLLASGLLPWQNLTATILFTDIRRFSTIAEKVPSQELMVFLNRYLSVMTDEVLRHKGIVNKFTGDGLMAVFGVPVPSTTYVQKAMDAVNAVRCALAMANQLQKLNQQLQLENWNEVQMRIGIFTGEVTVGSLGGPHRLEYGVIGDSVNTASRLESYDKNRQSDPCRILIARQTLDYLGDKFETEFWGALELHGKQQRVEIYRVIRSKVQ